MFSHHSIYISISWGLKWPLWNHGLELLLCHITVVVTDTQRCPPANASPAGGAGRDACAHAGEAVGLARLCHLSVPLHHLSVLCNGRHAAAANGPLLSSSSEKTLRGALFLLPTSPQPCDSAPCPSVHPCLRVPSFPLNLWWSRLSCTFRRPDMKPMRQEPKRRDKHSRKWASTRRQWPVVRQGLSHTR